MPAERTKHTTVTIGYVTVNSAARQCLTDNVMIDWL